MPKYNKKAVSKTNQGAQDGLSGNPGNIHYLPKAGGTDKDGRKPPASGNKGREIARTGKG